VSEYPTHERVEESKQRLIAMNVPVPSPNPIALAQAQPRENKGIFGRVFSVFSRRPDVSTETPAASVTDSEDTQEDDSPGTFTIDPAVVQPNTPPPGP
jgi:hypothetical protein